MEQAEHEGDENGVLYPWEEDEEDDPYWAAEAPDRLIQSLNDQERRYYDAITQGGFRGAWIGAFCAYYGLDPDTYEWATQSVGLDGEEGELLLFRVNEFRSYMRQMSTMAAGQRPSFQAVANNTDYDTLATIETSDQAVNYIYHAKYGERKERKTIERGDLFGIGWTWLSFDAHGGDEVDEPVTLDSGEPAIDEEGEPLTRKTPTGDLIMRSLQPWNCVCDPYIEDDDEHLWRMAKVKRSKWELAAEYPEHRERILDLGKSESESVVPIEQDFDMLIGDCSEDEVYVRHFYHLKSSALPLGRYTIYVGDIALYDSLSERAPMPFRRLPFAEYCPAEFMGTALGYADCWDTIPLQQMADQVISDVATNVAAFGRQSWYTEEGVDFDVQDLSDGLQVLTGRPGQPPPQPISPAGGAHEGAGFLLPYIERKWQSITGLNATARGQQSEHVKSGTMAALYHAIAQEVNGWRQAAVDAHRERVANLILEILQDFMEQPWMLEIAGHDERPYLQSVSPSAFKGIRRVTVKTANPMLRTQAGRLEIAKVLIETGSIKDPQKILELLVSGQLKPTYQGPRSRMLHIRWENERLASGAEVTQQQDPENPWQVNPQAPVLPDGTPNVLLDEAGQPVPNMVDTVPSVPVVPSDNPQMHVLEHAVPLERAIESGDQRAQRALLAHIYEHIRAWKTVDPALAALMGYPPPPPIGGASMAPSGGLDGEPEGQIDGELTDVDDQERDGATGVRLPKPAQPPASYQAR